MTKPKVYTIPAGAPFADALIEGIRSRWGESPLALAEATVLLPTRRAVRTLREAFLRASGGRPILLPALQPIGDIDEEGLVLEGIPEALDIPPAIDGLRRQLILARLVRAERARAGMPVDATQAIALAAELGRLLDRFGTERVDLARLKDLAPAEFAVHWQVTLDFLGIVTAHWPKILAEERAVDPAMRRDRLIGALAAKWSRTPPAHPVVAAGSTGSIPATAELLAAVARLPQGAVVLPGLDMALDAASWDAIEPGHPQSGLKSLLDVLGVARETVEPWTRTETDSSSSRAVALSLALAPAKTVDFAARRAEAEAGLAGLVLVDAPSPRDEADAIALMMRGALETPGRTAALITPDRGLTRRVAGALSRWGLAVDDSAGEPLSRTPPATFLRLLAAAASEPDDPVALLALLKHPLARAGYAVEAHKAHVRALDLALRGARPSRPLAVLGADHPARPWAEGVGDILAPLVEALSKDEASLGDLVRAHVAAAEALATEGATSGAARLWMGDAGETLAGLAADIEATAAAAGPVEGRSYAALFDALLAGIVQRSRFGAHPRLFIWGLLEARLQRADLTILGGLNEGVWPGEVEADPWMSRAMREAIGLAPPERRIGLAAHDFVQAAAAPDVVLTRAARIEGAMSVPSRWISRLDAAAPEAMKAARARGETWLAEARALDRPKRVEPCAQPAPAPRADLRPKSLSVTEIETWMRDPYAIYARHILRLRALDPLDADPGAADRGTFIHRALAAFLEECKGGLPPDALDRLIAMGRKEFATVADRPGLHAFWWPRFERIAGWFIGNETERRPTVVPLAWEAKGRLDLDGFVLTARADRIDRRDSGKLAIVDYKTGRLPKPGDVSLGFAPQLTLEGAIAMTGGFADVGRAEIEELEYWRLGGREDGKIAALKDGPDLIAPALAGLKRLIAAFADERTPYRAVPRSDFAPGFSDYRHLERIDEWSSDRTTE